MERWAMVAAITREPVHYLGSLGLQLLAITMANINGFGPLRGIGFALAIYLIGLGVILLFRIVRWVQL